MQKTINLTIISPTKKDEFKIKWLEAHSTKGSFIIEPGHTPIIARLDPGKEIIFLTNEGITEKFVITDGVLKLENDTIIIILTQ